MPDFVIVLILLLVVVVGIVLYNIFNKSRASGGATRKKVKRNKKTKYGGVDDTIVVKYGGSFVPPTKSHKAIPLMIAKTLKHKKNVIICITPCSNGYNKESVQKCPPGLRLAMSQKLVEIINAGAAQDPELAERIKTGNLQFVLETCEIDKPSQMGTLDSLKEMQAKYDVTHKDLLVCYGYDAILPLCSRWWIDTAKILSDYNLLVIKRDEYGYNPADILSRLTTANPRQVVDPYTKEEAETILKERLFFLDDVPGELSSSKFRATLTQLKPEMPDADYERVKEELLSIIDPPMFDLLQSKNKRIQPNCVSV